MAAPAAQLDALPTWDLLDLYASPEDPRLASDLDMSEARAKAFAAKYKTAVRAIAEAPQGGAALADAVRVYESIEELVGRIGSYASLIHAARTGDPSIARFYGTVQERLTRIGTELLFFELELNELDAGVLERALEAEALARYAPWIRQVRAFRPHHLSADLERLFREKDLTSASAWSRLFDETIADMSFEVRGEGKSAQEALNLLSDPRPDMRKDAAEGLTRGFRAKIRLFTLIYNTLIKDKAISDEWRKFAAPQSARHLSNQVEPEVVDALVSAVKDAYPQLSHRYYALKARWFGVEALNFWDRNAPLPKVDEPAIPWGRAKSIVLEAYGGFAPEMAEIAGRFFDKRWIDAEVRAGKSPGAFSHPTVPSVHPYVLMNYLGKTRDVMTLAHELGHGVHQVLAARQGLFLSATPLTLAETASVFGEMLTFRKLLSETTDAKQRRALLAAKVEDMLNTVVRQIAFYEFETRAHAKRAGGELSAEDLAEIWLSVQRESLGPAILQNDGYDVYWCYIPHFIHSPFYVYAYAFGDCLVNSLYAIYQQSDKSFVDKYFAMLKAGGSRHHSELLAPFGLDARDPGFWAKGLSVIASLIDELEAVADGK